jgi:hypothetical protein
MCTVLQPMGVNPIAFKYIILYNGTQSYHHVRESSPLIANLNQINSAHSIPSHFFYIIWILSSHLRLGLQSGLFTFLNQTPLSYTPPLSLSLSLSLSSPELYLVTALQLCRLFSLWHFKQSYRTFTSNMYLHYFERRGCARWRALSYGA